MTQPLDRRSVQVLGAPVGATPPRRVRERPASEEIDAPTPNTIRMIVQGYLTAFNNDATLQIVQWDNYPPSPFKDWGNAGRQAAGPLPELEFEMVAAHPTLGNELLRVRCVGERGWLVEFYNSRRLIRGAANLVVRPESWITDSDGGLAQGARGREWRVYGGESSFGSVRGYRGPLVPSTEPREAQSSLTELREELQLRRERPVRANRNTTARIINLTVYPEAQTVTGSLPNGDPVTIVIDDDLDDWELGWPEADGQAAVGHVLGDVVRGQISPQFAFSNLGRRNISQGQANFLLELATMITGQIERFSGGLPTHWSTESPHADGVDWTIGVGAGVRARSSIRIQLSIETDKPNEEVATKPKEIVPSRRIIDM